MLKRKFQRDKSNVVKQKKLSLILLSNFRGGALFTKKRKKKKDGALPVAAVVMAIYRNI